MASRLGKGVGVGARAAASSGSGSGSFVVWNDTRTDGSAGDVFGARVDSTGTVLDPAGIPIAATAQQEGFPTVAYNATFLVAWIENRSSLDIRGARVDIAGRLLDTAGFAVAATSTAEAAASVSRSQGDKWVVSYHKSDDSEEEFSVFLRGVSPTGSK